MDDTHREFVDLLAHVEAAPDDALMDPADEHFGRATRWVFVVMENNKAATSAHAFLKALHKACPIKIVKLLTDNGKGFTDRLFASHERQPSGQHEFGRLCTGFGIERRLTKPPHARDERNGRAL